jgi:hypothetical protein
MMRKLSQLLMLLRTRSLRRSLGLLAIIFAFSPTWLAAQTLPTPPEHIVIVIEENHSYDQIMKFVRDHDDSYLKSLMDQGATLTSFFALHHPSQPNYIVLFSGDRQGVKSNKCPHRLTATSLGGELMKKQLTVPGPDGAMTRSFKGYAEDLPSADPAKCKEGPYARKHVPWTNFADVPPNMSFPLRAFKEIKDFKDLPTVAMVIPNLVNDMHDRGIGEADTWLRSNLEAYVEWAKTHNSLLIITWDEDNRKNFLWFNRTTKPPSNRIPTIFIGPMVKPGAIGTQYTHLDLLRTIEEMYGLPLLGKSKDARVITDVWK